MGKSARLIKKAQKPKNLNVNVNVKEKESEFMNLWRCEYEVNMNTFLSEYEGFEGFDGIGEISKNENLVIYD